ncbi:IclR family transcriptional regulator [Bradyrhizobium liaoningense]|uniref:IclR family transcriptional regulator n=1 Tax=Bradyrhizobium liaoningense TaxID=43992 RepID=UPI001BAE4C44|nr:IclR family transcriptional regulator [Bradyrhizobium liaoningense]MBR0843452.1 IclR family transcriptional regulator [Bradyrhizobium liaoningense]MBR0856830.1 IclR family transcriptional regulator [Bradyrhizobium liaoningense]
MDKAFTKGLRLLETLALSEQPRGVTDLASELKLTKSNVHRLLVTLQSQGYVRQIPQHSTYELTTKIWALGSHVIHRMDLINVARPAMTKLAEITGETIHLSVLEDTDVVYVDKIESAHHIRAHTSVGMRAPAFTMATGKAMLAHMPDDYLERFRPHLRRYTETTRTTIRELREDIELARAQGYSAVLHGEWREGIAACACAILGRSGELVGAIGMSGPDTRVKRKQIKEYSAHVMEAARTIGAALGYSNRPAAYASVKNDSPAPSHQSRRAP